jgi:aconitate hydratase
VLSGNRNFEGRVHPEIKMNILASPPLVVAYALAGTMDVDSAERRASAPGPMASGRACEHLAFDKEVADACSYARLDMFRKSYANVFDGEANWQSIKIPLGKIYAGKKVHLRAQSALLRGHDHDAAP